MSEIEAGINMNVILALVSTVLSCIIIHYVYNIFGNKKTDVQERETEGDVVEPAPAASENAVTDNRPSKTKKRATRKQKTEFSHPWLLKNLKGHPGNILMVDFSANGKFMAATCDGESRLHPGQCDVTNR
ncbi:unnamed protein product [Leptosia nina]|uniref:Uncharacterized protein n=1 Tax=Leptosia nina TaxID=320188 RepID=A0AAV1JR81_9NEOP